MDLGPVYIDEVGPNLKRKATSPLMINREQEVICADDNMEIVTVEVVAGDEGKVRIKDEPNLMSAQPSGSTLSQSSTTVPGQSEYYSDNSASLPGISGLRHGPVGFEPGMFKGGISFVPASDTAGPTKTPGGKTDSSGKPKKKKKEKKKHKHRHKHKHHKEKKDKDKSKDKEKDKDKDKEREKEKEKDGSQHSTKEDSMSSSSSTPSPEPPTSVEVTF